MSSTTPRVSLYKPVGGENVNVTTDLNNNWDKIDTNLNFRVVASATARNAISPYWEGLGVRQSDNGKLYVSNGSSPISASWTEIVQTNNEVAGEMLVGNLIRSTRATSADSAYETRVTGASNAHWFVKASGEMWWGSGSGIQDTNLYRTGANVLHTDDTFTASGDLSTGGNLIFSANSAEKSSDLSVSSTVASSTTETVIGTFPIPAGDMVVGATYRVTCWGTAGVAAATTPTLTIRGRVGGLTGTSNGTIIITASSGVTAKVWKATYLVVCLSTGAGGTFHGNLEVAEGVSVAGSNPSTCVVRMDGNSTVAVDTTAAKDMVITAQWSANSASNTLTCRGYLAERIA